MALSALYAHELSGNSVSTIIETTILNLDEEKDVKEFAADLLTKCVEHKEELEELIIQQAHNWKYDRIAVLDTLTMRIAICEFLYFKDIPPKVTIDEAIEISKKYSTEKSGTFVNGVLDGVLILLKKAGRLKKSGRGLQE